MENEHKVFGQQVKTKTINVVCMNGGVGDHVASLTPINYMLKKYPWITPLVFVPDFMKEVTIHLLPKGTNVFSYSEMPGRYQPTRTTKTTKWDGHTSSMKIQTVDYAFLKILDELPPITERNYLKIRRDEIDIGRRDKGFGKDEFVVITTCFTSRVKEFLPEHCNQVVDYIRAKGYEVVFLGSEKMETGVTFKLESNTNKNIDYSKGLNLVNKTTLLQAAAIMADSKCVVGVDNGLLHMAATSDVPIVAGYTFVSPETTAPIRHNQIGWNVYSVLPDETLDCKYCQETTNLLYSCPDGGKPDYRRCWFTGVKGLEDRVNLCAKQMTSDKFIAHLEHIL